MKSAFCKAASSSIEAERPVTAARRRLAIGLSSVHILATIMTNTPTELLLVDDDTELSEMLSAFLELQGFSVRTAGSGEAALAALDESLPELIVLDVMLPGISGFEVLKALRKKYETPVIMLTARGDEPDRIHGLTEGADDYLCKPFSPLELAARINVILKRAARQEDSVPQLRIGPLLLDLATCELTVSDTAVSLTAAEMHVLEQFLRHPNEVLSRAGLTEQALGRPLEAYDRSIDTLISKVRKKLAAAGIDKECIRGLRGHGYVLDSHLLTEPS
jgi:DNA-binding response OmpR family regulator